MEPDCLGQTGGRAAVLSAWSVFLVQRPPFLACPGVSAANAANAGPQQRAAPPCGLQV